MPCPCFIPLLKVKANTEMCSALQLKKGMQKGETTFLALSFEAETDATATSGLVPEPVAQLMEEFQDIMPVELPSKLPPRREIDHAIELVPGAKTPAQAPYRMAPSELDNSEDNLASC